MYELKQGTARLINALEQRKDNQAAIKRIAADLDYLPAQLREDIQALYDYYRQAEADKE